MDMLALSQKQKVMLFLVVLVLGFVALAGFTSSRLSHMSDQYHSSSDIATGSMSIYQTQSKILTLSSNLDNLNGALVNQAKQEIGAIVSAVKMDAEFLTQVKLDAQADKLMSTVSQFESAANPWLNLKQELGFTIDEGKLGELKQLANTIEKKIEETGMVTLNSDFQAMVKSQQNYLL